jgi:hypothetical protein
MSLLLQSPNEGWRSFTRIREDRRYNYFTKNPSLVNKDPSHCIPIDILNTNANYYITNKPVMYEPQSKPQQLIQWEQRIFKNKMNDCKLFHTTEDIKMILANYKLIDVATDGSHDPKTGKMSFGWVVAVGEYISCKAKAQQKATQPWQQHFKRKHTVY